MKNLKTEALNLHKKLEGKVELSNKMEVTSLDELSLLYSPGVAEPCLEIQADPQKSYDYTWKGNTIAVVSNGTAVLGLGNIGAAAAMPVMEGKSMLFKAFGGVNAVPLVLDSMDSDEIIRSVELLAPTFGGINLEDIKAPECVYIEQELKKRLDIPVFHDDQHGTAIVVMAGLMNAYKLMNKDLKEAKVVVSGTGAAGSSIIRMLYEYGVRDISASNSKGLIDAEKKAEYDFVVQEICDYVTPLQGRKTVQDAMHGADIFIGVSVANLLTKQDIQNMNADPVVFALANPNPEIPYDDAIAAGARIVGTGRSDYPNQINNVLAFPGIFKGALASQAREINEAMKLAAAEGIASIIAEEDLSETNIVPNALDESVSEVVAQAVADCAKAMGVTK